MCPIGNMGLFGQVSKRAYFINIRLTFSTKMNERLNGLLKRGWQLLASLARSMSKMYIPAQSSYIKHNLSACGGGDTAHMGDNDFEKKRDLILFLLKQADKIEGRTRFQKMIFLGQKELGLPELFGFKKYHYGPYSQELADIIQSLVLRGDLKETIEDFGNTIKYNYELGSKAETETDVDFNREKIDIETLKRLGNLPLDLILTYVYDKYCPGEGFNIRVQVE